MATASGIARVVESVGPHRLVGAVVAGFQRGSKQLGWPTANLDPRAFEQRFDAATEGVYVGWAAIGDPTLPTESRGVHKAVLSIGWNVSRPPCAPSAQANPNRPFRSFSHRARLSFLSLTLTMSRSARSRRTCAMTLADATFTTRR